MVILYHAGGATDFNIVKESAHETFRRLRHNVVELLRYRGQTTAAAWLLELNFRLAHAVNHFADEFSILYVQLPLHDYEQLRRHADEFKPHAKQIVGALEELGEHIRFIAVELQLEDVPVVGAGTAAEPTATRADGPPKRFSLALSFAGEHRQFVEQVAADLSRHVGRQRLLYDKYYEAEFVRPDLDSYLQRLYHEESELIAVFLCADYERKEWCGLEWGAIRDLIKRRQSSHVMLLRFDMTEIPGLFSTAGYVWIGDRTPAQVADLILGRLGGNANPPSGGAPTKAVQTTPARIAGAATTAPLSSPALSTWKKKLAFLETEAAKAADPEQKFAIRERIVEAMDRIRELEGRSS